MGTKRSYGEGCLISHGLDLVGERWAMLVVRELLLGPKRFTDLETGLNGASPNVLSQRLRELEQTGVVHRYRLPAPSRAWVYELTEWGYGLERTLMELGQWAARSPIQDRQLPWSVDSLLVAIRTQYRAENPDDSSGHTCALRVGDDCFTIVFEADRLNITRGLPTSPDATVETDLPTFHRVVIGDESPEDVEADGRLKAVGDSDAIRRLVDAMTLDDPCP